MAMLCDLCFWQQPEIAGFRVEHLPCDVLANFWQEIHKRKLRDINDHNYSAAVVADLDQAAAEKRKKLKVEKWLPYDLASAGKPQVAQSTADIAKELAKAGLLPPKMERDLYKHQIIKPGD
jgi:hypothetical protein